MSIAPNTLERGVAALFRQPLSQEDERQARNMIYTVFYVNRISLGGPQLRDVMYRNSTDNRDLLRHVYRFDLRAYADVFSNGFQAQPQGNIDDDVYYNLLDHVNSGSASLNPNQVTPRAFVNTTVDSAWRPSAGASLPVGTSVYRYEIFAPGGIWVNETLGGRYIFRNQREVAFVGGIAPQYVRAAVQYVITGYDVNGRVVLDWADLQGANPRTPRIYLSTNFSPQSDPEELMRIQNPIYYYYTGRDANNNNDERRPLTIVIWRGGQQQDARGVSPIPRRPPMEWEPVLPPPPPVVNAEGWYTQDVLDIVSHINAAFRTFTSNQAYLFMKNEYVLVDYAPGSTNDRVLEGPRLIREGIPSLAVTDFAEHGIDCAFGTHYTNEAYVFCSSLCALVLYTRGSDRILAGPMLITEMFPFFKGTDFEDGVDAAFEATAKDEAYLFKGKYYALINYRSPPRLIHLQHIAHNWGGLTGTIFESDIDAAFASHRRNEAYIFKGPKYALINFAPGSTGDYIIGGVKDIVPNNWPSLVGIVPRENRGLDAHGS